MPDLSPRRLLGHRRAALVAAAGVVLAAVVAANQPRGAATPAPAAAAATPVPRHETVVRAGAPGLRLLHDRVVFAEDLARARPPRLRAAEGVLVDLDQRTILWERDPHTPRPPASTTKILSSLVALENYPPDQLVTVTPGALTQAGDETVMGLKAGERLTVRELLSGMLLVSGNDAATALAVDTVGLPAFVDTMNLQLAALGLRDSHFVTPVGLDAPGQQASAYDLAAVAAADVDTFPVFSQIVSRSHTVLPANAGHPAFDLYNLNRLLQLYPAAVGIKPGWTGDAGSCLVGMAVRGGHRLVAVLMNDPGLYTDARDLLDWGFVQEGLPSLLPTPTPAPHRRP